MNGEILKRLRIAKGVSQKDVATFLGIDRTTYLKYESGASNPNLSRLMQLANYFDTTPDYLLNEPAAAHIDNQTVIGKALKQLRKERGLTQAEVADALHLNRSTYTKYETGSNAPSAEQIKNISKIFRVTTDDILKPQPQEKVKLVIPVKSVIKSYKVRVLDEKTIEIAKQFQQLDKIQQIAIEQIIKGLLQGKE